MKWGSVIFMKRQSLQFVLCVGLSVWTVFLLSSFARRQVFFVALCFSALWKCMTVYINNPVKLCTTDSRKKNLCLALTCALNVFFSGPFPMRLYDSSIHYLFSLHLYIYIRTNWFHLFGCVDIFGFYCNSNYFSEEAVTLEKSSPAHPFQAEWNKCCACCEFKGAFKWNGSGVKIVGMSHWSAISEWDSLGAGPVIVPCHDSSDSELFPAVGYYGGVCVWWGNLMLLCCGYNWVACRWRSPVLHLSLEPWNFALWTHFSVSFRHAKCSAYLCSCILLQWRAKDF